MLTSALTRTAVLAKPQIFSLVAVCVYDAMFLIHNAHIKSKYKRYVAI